MKRTYETGWQDVPDDDHYVSERLLVDTFNNFQILGDKVQSVGVALFQNLIREDDLSGVLGQYLPDHPVGAVSDAGLVQRAIQNNFEAVSIGIAPAVPDLQNHEAHKRQGQDPGTTHIL